VRAVLTLPDGCTITSGNNPAVIGNMNGATSKTVAWNVMFQQNGTYTLQVTASGNDSNGSPCSVSKSTTVHVGEFPQSPISLEMLFIILIVIGVILTVIFVSVFVLLKRKSHQPPQLPPPPPLRLLMSEFKRVMSTFYLLT